MKPPVRKPLCGSCEDGWVVDPETFQPIRRCACRLSGVAAPEVERDAALQVTADANPNALTAAVRIITDTARRLETFSSNDCRAEMIVARVPGPVIGAAFGRAVRDGLIRRDGYVPSTQAATHGHPVAQWRSRIYTAGRVSA